MEQDPRILVDKNKYYYPQIYELENMERLRYMIQTSLKSTYLVTNKEELFSKFTYKTLTMNDSYLDITQKFYHQEDIINNMKLQPPSNLRQRSVYGEVSLKNQFIICSPFVCTSGINITIDQARPILTIDLNNDKFKNYMQDIDNKMIELLFGKNVDNKLTNIINGVLNNSNKTVNDFFDIFYRLVNTSVNGERCIKFNIHPTKTNLVNNEYEKSGAYCKVKFRIDGIWYHNSMMGVKKTLLQVKFYKKSTVHNRTIKFD